MTTQQDFMFFLAKTNSSDIRFITNLLEIFKDTTPITSKLLKPCYSFKINERYKIDKEVSLLDF